MALSFTSKKESERGKPTQIILAILPVGSGGATYRPYWAMAPLTSDEIM